MIKVLKSTHHIRVLVIVRNPGLNLEDRDSLFTSVRKAVKFKIINIRIASEHIEFDINVNNISDVDELKRLGLEVMDVVNIDIENETEVNSELNEWDSLIKYVELFNKERFWEAHEVLERIWHKNRNEGIRGLIVLAAAFVKLQENNPEAFRELMIIARELIANNEIPWINRESLLRKIDNALATMKLFKIEETDIKRI